MTIDEFGKIAMAIKTYYPRENVLPNAQAIELWYRQLADISYEVAEIGLNKWVSCNKWPPTISDFREMAAEVTNGQIDDWGSAWESVVSAIGTYGIYKTAEAMDSFDEITRQAVQRIGFRNICMSEDITIDRANFRMIYEQLAERKKQDAKLPPRLKEIASEIKAKMLEGGKIVG